MADTAQIKQVNKALVEKEGKYLTFALGAEEYGLEILKVREIIGYMEITAVPQTPHYVKGVINLRGQVIPVIDLRSKFGMETKEITEESCIIVVEIHQDGREFSTGVVVDKVEEVLDIAGEIAKKLEDIVQGRGKNSDLVSEIAAASQEQSQGIDQVNVAMAQMDKVTQQNAANAEESASASEELSAQSEGLQNMASEFKLTNTGRRSTTKVNNAVGKTHELGKSNQVFHNIAGGSRKTSET